MRYALWGRKAGEPVWMERLLLSEGSKAQCEKIKELAKRDGYEHFRLTKLDGEKPNFAGTVNI